ncbi:MAG: hypothetical protein ABIY55_28650, partial [Kofleriaceae bacterium]
PDAQSYPPPPPDAPCDGPTMPGPTTCTGARVEVFAIYEASSNHRGAGDALVKIDHPGTYRLVLSSYEETRWHVSLVAGATVEAVYLYGYDKQTVDLPNVPVTTHTFASGDYGCGYSYPYNGMGCDTNDLLARVDAEAGPLHAFHGCYRATQWLLNGDDTVISNCDTAAGYVQDDFTSQVCKPPTDWQRTDFVTLDKAACTGDRFVRHDDKYNAWVGAIQCGDAAHYKLYMSGKHDGVYLEIADFSGHGQDHCELVNPGFTLPDEDNITSGGCTTCALGDLIDIIGKPVYARAVFGEPFKQVMSRQWADLTTNVYACGVSIP